MNRSAIVRGFFIAMAIVVVVVAALVGFKCFYDSVSAKDTPSPSPPSRAEFQQLLINAPAIEGDLPYKTYIALAFTAGCPGPVIYDTTNTVQDTEWLAGKYGTALTWGCVEPHPDADYVFRLTELRESCGPAVYITNLKDENGYPLEGRAVIRAWPGSPPLPYYDPPASRYLYPDDSEGSVYIGNVGYTSGVGDVGFGVGSGDAYDPVNSSGVTNIYIADYDGPSDILRNLGWLAWTEHCTLFPVFYRVPKEDVVTPTPEPTGIVQDGLLRIEEFYIRVEPVGTPEP